MPIPNLGAGDLSNILKRGTSDSKTSLPAAAMWH
jgi:hypothetical protein